MKPQYQLKILFSPVRSKTNNKIKFIKIKDYRYKKTNSNGELEELPPIKSSKDISIYTDIIFYNGSYDATPLQLISISHDRDIVTLLDWSIAETIDGYKYFFVNNLILEKPFLTSLKNSKKV